MLGWRISLFKARPAAIVIVCQRQDRLSTVIREPRRHPAGSSPNADILCALIVPVRFQFSTMCGPKVLVQVNVSRLPRMTAWVLFPPIVVQPHR